MKETGSKLVRSVNHDDNLGIKISRSMNLPIKYGKTNELINKISADADIKHVLKIQTAEKAKEKIPDNVRYHVAEIVKTPLESELESFKARLKQKGLYLASLGRLAFFDPSLFHKIWNFNKGCEVGTLGYRHYLGGRSQGSLDTPYPVLKVSLSGKKEIYLQNFMPFAKGLVQILLTENEDLPILIPVGKKTEDHHFASKNEVLKNQKKHENLERIKKGLVLDGIDKTREYNS
ncbi:MAG: hypothetical protein US50_C0004G0012 [Candidatus Nomurabacteria bacterium GW2011_GWB1_37_5]|uniref:Uncharacterized protein n=1 Tax=Candidatus Nomurabacteria bacterium GW2011_GWB1_37_5 TaxID=1618742 RepID=A0A0G0GXW7_9BACT|nr:MAG: hypothetical protein US50_C0004G0012 [Candidatus Nomurabacteria bacterium GW2011_GWB1_37_5]